MGISVFPAPVASSKTRFVVTLTTGTSWTVPAGVTYVNAKLFGGGGGGGGATGTPALADDGKSGQVIESNVATTPGASIAYAIGAGGTGGAASNGPGGNGGATTFTGATSATGGLGGGTATTDSPAGRNSVNGEGAGNGGGRSGGFSNTGGTGGTGKIEIEYWV